MLQVAAVGITSVNYAVHDDHPPRATLRTATNQASVGATWGRPKHESTSALRAEMVSSEALERMMPYLPAGDVTAALWQS